MVIIPLKKNPNIRDIGGKYKDVTIKEGKLIRGRTLKHLSEDQIHILRDVHHLKTIIDLRSHEEADESPEINIEGVNYELIPIFEREKQGISHKDGEKVDSLAIYKILPTMDKIYFDMLHGESLTNFGKVINRIITANDDDFAFYFHCSEGKDRTGIVAAILLLILGVSRNEIIKDYMATNKMAKPKAFKYYMNIKYVRFDAMFALKVGRTFLAKKKYIQVLFDVIDKEFGSLLEFLLKGLNLKVDDIYKFRERMIAK